MEINSLRDLKKYVNSIPEERLDDAFIVEKTETFQHKVTSVYELQEDFFENDEGIDPISSFEPEDDSDQIENYTILPKGTVFFSCDNEEEDEKWRQAQAIQQAERDKNLIAQGKLMAQRPVGGITQFLSRIVETRAFRGNLPEEPFLIDYKLHPYSETMSYRSRIFTLFTDHPELYDSMTDPETQKELLNTLSWAPQDEYFNLSKVQIAFEKFGYTWLIKKFENEKDVILPETKS